MQQELSLLLYTKAKKQDQPLHDKNKRILLTISKILQLHAQLTITVCS